VIRVPPNPEKIYAIGNCEVPISLIKSELTKTKKYEMKTPNERDSKIIHNRI
jgi:hypothetical protein